MACVRLLSWPPPLSLLLIHENCSTGETESRTSVAAPATLGCASRRLVCIDSVFFARIRLSQPLSPDPAKEVSRQEKLRATPISHSRWRNGLARDAIAISYHHS